MENVRCQLEGAISNLAANIRYEHFEDHGPKKQKITKDDPLFPRYVVCAYYVKLLILIQQYIRT